jgi:hypothetical protein
MNALTPLVTAALLLGIAAETRAATNSIAVEAGWSSPSRYLAPAVGDGFHVGVSAARLLDSRNWLGLEANYHSLGEKTNVIYFWAPIAFASKARVFEALPFIRIDIARKGSPIVPFVKVGSGVECVLSEVTIRTPLAVVKPDSKPQWSPGAFGGVGITAYLGSTTALSLEGQCHLIESEAGSGELYTLALSVSSSGKRDRSRSPSERPGSGATR